MYRISLDEFEGPLDLLLFFIRRDELDIYDIPIARITEEFLLYVRVLEVVDLDRAGEFIYMAALLIEIKVRMMLPRPELDEDGEAIDPRRELVERLIEYQRYKTASEQLGDLENERARHYARLGPVAGKAAFSDRDEEPEFSVSLYRLVSALARVLEKSAETRTHEVAANPYQIEEQRAFVLMRVGVGERLPFSTLVSRRDKGFVIVTFLAVLEMVRQGLVLVFPRVSDYDFFIERTSLPVAA